MASRIDSAAVLSTAAAASFLTAFTMLVPIPEGSGILLGWLYAVIMIGSFAAAQAWGPRRVGARWSLALVSIGASAYGLYVLLVDLPRQEELGYLGMTVVSMGVSWLVAGTFPFLLGRLGRGPRPETTKGSSAT